MLESSDEVWHGTASTIIAPFLLASSTAILSRDWDTSCSKQSAVHGMEGAVSKQKTLVAGVSERDPAWGQPSKLKPASWGMWSPAAQPVGWGFQATEELSFQVLPGSYDNNLFCFQ